MNIRNPVSSFRASLFDSSNFKMDISRLRSGRHGINRCQYLFGSDDTMLRLNDDMEEVETGDFNSCRSEVNAESRKVNKINKKLQRTCY